MIKKAASVVLVSPTTSLYPKGTPAVLASPAASVDDLFDHPVASVTTASRRIAMNHPG
jgi:hypothetical protein